MAFAPKTRSGSRTARLTVSAPLAVTATVSLSGDRAAVARPPGGWPRRRSGTIDGTGAAPAFQQPVGIASDGAGNLFVADCQQPHHPQGRHRHRRRHHARDRSPRPEGIAADGAGNLFVTDRATPPSGRSLSPPGPSRRSRARQACRYPRASPATGRATSSSPMPPTPSGRSSSPPAPSPRSPAPQGTSPEDRGVRRQSITSRRGGQPLRRRTQRQIRKVVIATGAVTTLVDATGAPVVRLPSPATERATS